MCILLFYYNVQMDKKDGILLRLDAEQPETPIEKQSQHDPCRDTRAFFDDENFLNYARAQRLGQEADPKDKHRPQQKDRRKGVRRHGSLPVPVEQEPRCGAQSAAGAGYAEHSLERAGPAGQPGRDQSELQCHGTAHHQRGGALAHERGQHGWKQSVASRHIIIWPDTNISLSGPIINFQ